MEKHRLTRWEATSLMVGAGVGAGIMAVPYLAGDGRPRRPRAHPADRLGGERARAPHARRGAVPHRARPADRGADAPVRAARPGRAAGCCGPCSRCLSVAFLANLAAYVSGAGEIVADLAGIDRRVAEVLVYVVSAGVVFFGLKAVGIAERFGALVLVGLRRGHRLRRRRASRSTCRSLAGPARRPRGSRSTAW